MNLSEQTAKAMLEVHQKDILAQRQSQQTVDMIPPRDVSQSQPEHLNKKNDDGNA